jgi:hypothetical protein
MSGCAGIGLLREDEKKQSRDFRTVSVFLRKTWQIAVNCMN